MRVSTTAEMNHDFLLCSPRGEGVLLAPRLLLACSSLARLVCLGRRDEPRALTQPLSLSLSLPRSLADGTAEGERFNGGLSCKRLASL